MGGLVITIRAVSGGGCCPVTPEEDSGTAGAQVQQFKLLLVLLQAGHGQCQRLLQFIVTTAACLTLLFNLQTETGE